MKASNKISKQIAAIKQIAREISLVENETLDGIEILKSLQFNSTTSVIGITGPPGAGKSSLLNALLNELLKNADDSQKEDKPKKIAIIAVDPSSPFNYGALLGDRIRLSSFYNNPNVFIRSVASRGSLGGLSEKIMEIVDLLRSKDFDYIFVETVGVGQSEVEIAALADTSIVVLVPESGDEIQTMKAGLLEIADIFVVNKSDRPQSDQFIQNLKKLVHSRIQEWDIPVIRSVAIEGVGSREILDQVKLHQDAKLDNPKRPYLLAEKVLRIIQKKRMADIDKIKLIEALKEQGNKEGFNIYAFAEQWD